MIYDYFMLDIKVNIILWIFYKYIIDKLIKFLEENIEYKLGLYI